MYVPKYILCLKCFVGNPGVSSDTNHIIVYEQSLSGLATNLNQIKFLENVLVFMWCICVCDENIFFFFMKQLPWKQNLRSKHFPSFP